MYKIFNYYSDLKTSLAKAYTHSEEGRVEMDGWQDGCAKRWQAFLPLFTDFRALYIPFWLTISHLPSRVFIGAIVS